MSSIKNNVRRLEAAGEDPDPLGRLRALGLAYRDSVLAEPGYDGVMFQQAIPGFRPSPESLVVAAASLEVLTRAVTAAILPFLPGPGPPATRRH